MTPPMAVPFLSTDRAPSTMLWVCASVPRNCWRSVASVAGSNLVRVYGAPMERPIAGSAATDVPAVGGELDNGVFVRDGGALGISVAVRLGERFGVPPQAEMTNVRRKTERMNSPRPVAVRLNISLLTFARDKAS